MRFIKKLVILSGSGAHGTLMIEKNSFGVWCKLSLFDLMQADNMKFVVISGSDLFVMKLDKSRESSISFKLGEMNFNEIHAAVVSNRVVMYGSNCALKLGPESIMAKVQRAEKVREAEGSLVTFSGSDKKIDDYFKDIAPPMYNDFALAEKNYYPAYITATDEAPDEEDMYRPGGDGKTIVEKPDQIVGEKPDQIVGEEDRQGVGERERQVVGERDRQSVGEKPDQIVGERERQVVGERERQGVGERDRQSVGEKPDQSVGEKERQGESGDEKNIFSATKIKTTKQQSVWGDLKVHSNKITPHELEQKYLRLLTQDNTVEAASTKEVPDEEVTQITITEMPKQEARQRENEPHTIAEKPEVIAMARRVTLRDYKVEGAKPMGRKATFFERSSERLNKLLNEGERFPLAEKLIPGSRFVKIHYDNKRFYIVGTIGSDYICYGVPAMYSPEPPEPLRGYATWLPYNGANVRGEGLWMMYQDGVSGKTLPSEQESR